MTAPSFSNVGGEESRQSQIDLSNGSLDTDANGFVDLYDSFALQLEKIYFKGHEDVFDVIKELARLVSKRYVKRSSKRLFFLYVGWY
jgi:hypothetical protein